MLENPMISWLVVGVVFFALEMLGVPGVGFLFAGLGALTVGGALDFALIPADDFLLQLLVFLASSALWAAILWKPLKKWKSGKHKQPYNNIVGQTAVVGDGGVNKLGGEVKWSGTIMKARLCDKCSVESLQAGAQVTITEINGNTLTVTPK